MQLPSKIVDITMPLDNKTVVDPEIMRPQIKYVNHQENAETMANFFDGMKPEDLPDGQAWAWEIITLTTHNGTHMDAPWHYHSHDKDGNRMQTIDELPLDWFFRPGVKLDFRNKPDGYVIEPEDILEELDRIEYKLQPMDIVLFNTKASEFYGKDGYLEHGIGMGKDATLFLTRDNGIRVTGIDAWGWDAPFFLAKEQYAKDGDALKVWQGHWAGIEQPYCHMEKLLNLEKLPAHGFMVSCFPWKIKDASGGFVRAVAMFD